MRIRPNALDFRSFYRTPHPPFGHLLLKEKALTQGITQGTVLCVAMHREIRKALEHYDISYKEAATSSELSDMLSAGGMAIVMSWNGLVQNYTSVIGYGAITTYKSPDYLSGAHIVLIRHDGSGNYLVYNAYSNKPTAYPYNSFEEFMPKGAVYIAGFYIG